MEKNTFSKNLLSGVFFLGGILLIFGIIFTIGKDKGFTQPKFQIDVLFRDVGGLVEGAPVQLAGVNVGTVSDISFLDKKVEGRGVKVEVSIFKRFKEQLSHNVRFSIKTEGILGEKLVEIHSDEVGGAVNLSEPVIGEDPLNVQDLAQVFSLAAESFTNTSQDFSKVDVVKLSKALEETAQSLVLTSEGLNTILTEMHYISIKSKRLLDRLEQRIIDGDLFKVF
jgi:phospholipid/cholesterol/gamma-HCH transport system substrate-binding protein